MTIQEVRDTLQDIERTKDSDPEHAHGAREVLYFSVLQHVAEGGRNGKTLAEEALKAADIRCRW